MSALQNPRLFLALLRAEIRHFWRMQLAVLGSGVFILVMLRAVTERVSTDATPEGVAFNYMASLIVSIAPVLLLSSGWASGRVRNRNEFWASLPLDRVSANLVRLCSLLVMMWPAMLTWPLIILLLFSVYGPTSPWALVNASFLTALGLLLSLRTGLAAILIYMALPAQTLLLHFLPGAEGIGQAWFELNGSSLCTIALSLLMFAFGRWALWAPTPR